MVLIIMTERNADNEENNLGRRIVFGIDSIIKKDTAKKLESKDFLCVWTDIVLLPVRWIEKLINESEQTKLGYTREQGVVYGLLLRIYKTLIMERQIVCAGLINHQLASMFSRMLYEDNINLQYYILNPDEIDSFCKSCAKAEQEFIKIVKQNRAERKEKWSEDKYKWEEGLLESAMHSLSLEGVAQEEKLSTIKDMKAKSEAVGLGDFYNIYRSNSHAIHGQWIDIVKYSLKEENGRYYPLFQIKGTDIREINSILLIVYKSLYEFLMNYSGHGIDGAKVIHELDKDRQLINNFDDMFFNFCHGQSVLTGLEDQIEII